MIIKTITFEQSLGIINVPILRDRLPREFYTEFNSKHFPEFKENKPKETYQHQENDQKYSK